MMKTCLMYNAGAGDAVSVEFLEQALARAGHTLEQAVQDEAELRRALDGDIDLIAVAGGDGTVRRAALAAVGRDIPLGILPLGTANNFARSLGIRGTISQVIAGWSAARRRQIDVGTIRGPWGETAFIEGVGSGVIPVGIKRVQAGALPKDESGSARVRAAATYLEVASRLAPKPMTVVADGLRLEHALLMLEVLNIRSVGPNLVLSRAADPSDGFLTLVAAGPEHRDGLERYLRSRIERRDTRLSLPTWQVRWLELSGCTELHVDDSVHEWPEPQSVSVCLGACSVPVLVPPDTLARGVRP